MSLLLFSCVRPFSHPHSHQRPRGFAARPLRTQWNASCCGMLRIPLIWCGCAARGSQITCLCVVCSMHNRNAHITSHWWLQSAPWPMFPEHRVIDQRRVANFACLPFSADGWSACALCATHCPSPCAWAPHLLHTYAHTWSPCACLLCVRFMMLFPGSSRPWVLREQTLSYMTLARHWSFPVC